MIEVYSFFIDSRVVVSVPMRGSGLGGAAAGNATDSVTVDKEPVPSNYNYPKNCTVEQGGSPIGKTVII